MPLDENHAVDLVRDDPPSRAVVGLAGDMARPARS